MDRETHVSDEGPREETEPEMFDEEGADPGLSEDVEELSDEPALDEGALEEAAEAGSEESEGPPRRRRRRRRGRGDRGPGDRGPREERRPPRPAGAPAESRSYADESDDDLDEDSGDLTGESELSAEDEDGEESPRVYRNVPTWEEAISFLVHKRPPEGRSRDDSGPREPRRDGGRPR
jgi:ribonuclease E